MTHLVDVGALVPVKAVSAADALHLALLELGCEDFVDRKAATVYEMSDAGKILRAIPVTESEAA